MSSGKELGGASAVVLAKEDFDALFAALRERGYEVIGPTLAEGAIVYRPIASARDLPRGWTDVQRPGHYQLQRRDDDRWFGFVVGPQSWKRYLFPPRVTVSQARQEGEAWEFSAPTVAPPRQAFLGVRACELAAIRVQDRVFLEGAYVDRHYQQRRAASLIIAVNCTTAAATCFCTSMKTGPVCRTGFDLALTELDDAFLVEWGSAAGQAIAESLPAREAADGDRLAATSAQQQAVDAIERFMDPDGLRDVLLNQLDHPRWADVASRCLSCANCTMVCPTCFCTSVREVSDLAGTEVSRERVWDSCFNIDFSYVVGGEVRDQIRSRYRQWLTHKLATWIDQFGTSGCVGCGRCITWCPVGIDLTEEVAALRSAEP